MRPLYIFDLDGTLALIEHRRHHVTNPYLLYDEYTETMVHHGPEWKPNWKQFYLDCVDDVPNPPVIDTLTMLANHADIQIFSGRSDEVETETRLWLSVHLQFLPTHHKVNLRMRRQGDHQPDDKLKEGWLNKMSDEDRKRLVAVFEDRSRLVKMWRRNGIACFQVAPGDF